MRISYRIVTLTITALSLSAPAATQTVGSANEWGRGTTLTGFAGIAVDSARSGPLVGGTVGWEITPRLAIDGSGMWVEHGSSNDVFAAALKVRAAPFGTRTRLRTAVPFLQAGIGMYRASFKARDDMPGFYRYRMHQDVSSGVKRSFTDPSLVFGGGADVFVSRNVAIRPDIEAMVVLRDSRSHVATALRINVVYHIEEHPVTPTRRGRSSDRAADRSFAPLPHPLRGRLAERPEPNRCGRIWSPGAAHPVPDQSSVPTARHRASPR